MKSIDLSFCLIAGAGTWGDALWFPFRIPVSQYVQGRILGKLISKVFVLATIGANKGEILEVKLNPTERALLQLVGEDKDALSVVDLTWPSVTISARAG